MNLFSVTLLTALLFRSSSILQCNGSNIFDILTRLPIGPYKYIIKQIGCCNPTQDNKIQTNFYLSHDRISNTTLIRGNLTNTIPLDDNLFLEMRFSFRDANGKWKENTLYQKSSKACTAMRNLMGPEWATITSGLSINTTTCPIPPGIYSGSGFDASIFSNTNFPKTFIYGTYRIQIYYTRNKEIYGCNIFVVEINPQ